MAFQEVKPERTVEMTDHSMQNIYRLLVEQSPVAMAVHEIIRDAQGTPADYRFLAANPAFGQHTGLDHENIIDQTVRQVLPGIDETDFVMRYGKVVDTGCPDRFESYSKPLNRYYAVDAFKVAENIFATIFSDITASKEAEAKRIAAEERHQSIIAASPDHFFVITREGRFLDVKTSTPNLLLANPEQITGKSIEEFLPPDITRVYYQVAEEVLRSRNMQAFEYELELSSERHTFEARVTAMNEDILLCVVRDITQQKNALSELARSEELFRLANEASMDHIWEFDPALDRKRWCKAGCLFGWEHEEQTGCSRAWWMDRVHPEDRARVDTLLEQGLSNAECTHLESQYRFQKADGTYATLSDRCYIVRDSNGQPLRLVGVMRDITHEADLLCQLEKSQRLYKLLVENQTDLVVKVDLEGRFEFVSPSYCRLFGKTEDELIGKCFMPLVHEEDRETTAQEMEKLFVPPYSCRVTQRAMTTDGWRWIMWSDQAVFDDHNTIIGIVGVGRDVTAETEAVEARNTLADQLSKAQEVANLGSWDYTHATDTLTWSDQLYRIFGLDKSSFKNTYEHFLSFVHEDDRQRIMDEFERSLHDPNTLYNTEHRIVRSQDGEMRWVEEQCYHERDADGTVIRSIGIAQDITERKNAERQKEELREQMLQAQKMESVGHLAGGVAHDFNNLLMVIIGCSEFILDSLKPDDPLREDVLQVVAAGKSATNLTRQLLAFSRKQTLQPVVLNINHIIENLEKMLGRLLGEHIAIKTALAEDIGLIRVDPGQLEQIIMNLAVNARDAMPEGGSLVIGTDNVYADHPGVQLSVTDTGCGMSKEVEARIFEPFFTTKELGKGTGLGLSTVYGIVKQSGGDIQVFSELGKGTSFKIFFPHTDAMMKHSSSASAMTSSSNANKHILLVEDAEILRKLIGRQLSKLGYIVTAAADGGEALSLVKDKRLVPDLIITDVIMPNMNGRELVKHLSKNHPHLKTIYMSGYADEAIMPHGILDSDTPFIQKPFGIHDLERKIQELFGHAPATTT